MAKPRGRPPKTTKKLSNIDKITDPIAKNMGMIRQYLDSVEGNLSLLGSEEMREIGKSVRYLLENAHMPVLEIADIIGLGKENAQLIFEMAKWGSKGWDESNVDLSQDETVLLDDQKILEAIDKITDETLLTSTKEKEYYARYVGAELMKRDGHQIKSVQDLTNYVNYVLENTERGIVEKYEVYRTAAATATKVAEIYMDTLIKIRSSLLECLKEIDIAKDRIRNIGGEVEEELRRQDEEQKKTQKEIKRIDINKEIEEMFKREAVAKVAVEEEEKMSKEMDEIISQLEEEEEGEEVA